MLLILQFAGHFKGTHLKVRDYFAGGPSVHTQPSTQMTSSHIMGKHGVDSDQLQVER